MTGFTKLNTAISKIDTVNIKRAISKKIFFWLLSKSKKIFFIFNLLKFLTAFENKINFLNLTETKINTK